MQEVREKRGLSYSVYSKFQPMLQEGPFIIGRKQKKNQVGEALKVVNSTWVAFLQNGPSEVELQAAKDHLVNSFAMQMDNNRKILEFDFHDRLLSFASRLSGYLDRECQAYIGR